jgi:uncharacterized RDD family membrane protein YckC
MAKPTAASSKSPASPAPEANLPEAPVVAGMKRRLAAYFLDNVVLFFVITLLVATLAWVGLWVSRAPDAAHPEVFEYNYPVAFLDMIIGLIVSGLYYATTWTVRGATLGQGACKLRVVDAADGLPLRRSQSWRRWFALGAPAVPVILLLPILWLNAVIAAVAFVWGVVLLATTIRQPMRRGLHDRYVGSAVVWVRNAKPTDTPAD